MMRFWQHLALYLGLLATLTGICFGIALVAIFLTTKFGITVGVLAVLVIVCVLLAALTAWVEGQL